MFEKMRVFGTLRHMEGGKQTLLRVGLPSECSAEISSNLSGRIEHLKRLERYLLSEQPLLRDEEIDAIIRRMAGRVIPACQAIVERIQLATNLFHHFIDTGLFSFLRDGHLHEPVQAGLELSGMKLFFGKKDTTEGMMMSNDQSRLWGIAYFERLFGRRIEFREAEPVRLADVIAELAKTGCILKELQGLQHELIHGLQDPETNCGRLIAWLSGCLNDVEDSDELDEAHATRADGVLPVVEYETRSATQMLMLRSHVLGGGENAYDFEYKRLEYAVRAIDQLHALGVGNREIARQIARFGRWDEEMLSFPDVENWIADVMKRKNIKSEELGGLVQAHRLEHRISRWRARRIAQEELVRWNKEFGEK